MYVTFSDPGIPAERRAEIASVLRRICVGQGRGRWRNRPDEIVVMRRMTGGTGGSDVLVVVVRWQNHRRAQVIKIGQSHDMRGEYDAFEKHLSEATALFAPIRAATPGVLDPDRARPGEREAVVYDHASLFVGKPEASARTIEEVVQEALARRGAGMDRAIAAVARLFEGVRSDLYERYEVRTGEESLEDDMNVRMGPALVVEIDHLAHPRELVLRQAPSAPPAVVRRYPDDLLDASLDIDAAIHPGEFVHLPDVEAVWRDHRLFAKPCEDMRVQVELISHAGPIESIAAEIAHGAVLDVHGRVLSTRARAHRDRLVAGGTELRFGKQIRGVGAEVSDPFPMLRRVLTERLAGRVVATVHGDLNPRNFLVVDDRQCLIDYADTRDGQPLYTDFARLEGSLLRGALSALAWREQVQLQRLLAAASRYGEGAADVFATGLRDARLEAVFRLLWTIRSAARSVQPPGAGQPWWREYLVHLFLFAHLTLKWPGQSAEALRATAAMAGVAAEVLEEGSIGSSARAESQANVSQVLEYLQGLDR